MIWIFSIIGFCRHWRFHPEQKWPSHGTLSFVYWITRKAPSLLPCHRTNIRSGGGRLFSRVYGFVLLFFFFSCPVSDVHTGSVRAKCSNLCADYPRKKFKFFPHKVDHCKGLNTKYWVISTNRSAAMNFWILGLFVLYYLSSLILSTPPFLWSTTELNEPSSYFICESSSMQQEIRNVTAYVNSKVKPNSAIDNCTIDFHLPSIKKKFNRCNRLVRNRLGPIPRVHILILTAVSASSWEK